SLCESRQLQSRSNVLVASLAVADLLVGLLIMPFSAARTAYNCWFYGDLFCHLHTWLDFSTCTSSIANLACISLERYASIAEPLRYRQMVTPRVLAAMLLLSWSGLPLYGATFMLGWNLVGIKRQVTESSCRHDCRVYMNPASTATNVLVAYVTPMLLMIVANAKIHRLARAQVRRIEGSAMVSGRASEPLLGYGTSRAAWEVVCWLPYLNSAVNPVLLMVFNRSFNGAFRLALKGGVLKSKCRGIDLFNFRDGNM
uniref:5-hydroxytryptamine receptor 4 n=1 Tax=Petromyzon marinus TaxID=7757 RepID=S4RH53_PETMA